MYRLGLFENVAAYLPKVSSIQTAGGGEVHCMEPERGRLCLGARFAMRHIAQNERRHEQRTYVPLSSFRKRASCYVADGQLFFAASLCKFEFEEKGQWNISQKFLGMRGRAEGVTLFTLSNSTSEKKEAEKT